MAEMEKPKEAGKVDISHLKPVDAPNISASSMTVQGTGNEFVLTFSRPVPLQAISTGEMNTQMVLNQPVVILSISPQTAKDIVIALSDSVAKHEKEYGEIVTPYTKRLAGSGGRTKGH